MDFVFGLPKDVDDNTGSVVFVDGSSKMAYIAAVPDEIDGLGSAKLCGEASKMQYVSKSEG